MSKILVMANSSSGLYDFRNELLTGLMDRGNEIVVSVPDEQKTKELSEEGCKVVHTEIKRRGVNPIQDMALLNSYRKLMKEEKPDLVVTYTIKPNIYGGYICGRLKIPFVATITGLGSTFERGGALLKLIVFLYKFSLKKCSCLFFQNQENREKFESYGIRAKKHVTVNGSGVNLDVHKFEEYLGHKDSVTRFLYIGRLMKEKGSVEYLEAAKTLHEKYGDKVSFSAVGYCEDDFQPLADEATSSGYLKTIPYQLNIHPYIKEADVIVNPSYHEGMSNVLMEAAATGRPVIATDISGCREVVEDGKSGFLCRPRDGKSLIDAMEKFMALSTSERSDMGRCARSVVEQKFDRRSIILTYISEVEQILNR